MYKHKASNPEDGLKESFITSRKDGDHGAIMAVASTRRLVKLFFRLAFVRAGAARVPKTWG